MFLKYNLEINNTMNNPPAEIPNPPTPLPQKKEKNIKEQKKNIVVYTHSRAQQHFFLSFFLNGLTSSRFL